MPRYMHYLATKHVATVSIMLLFFGFVV